MLYMAHFKELIVWQKSVDMAEFILNYITKEQFEEFNQKISHITRILNSLIYSNKTSQ